MTDERIKKLPVWTQELIASLERQREEAIRALNQYVDSQTPSPFFIDELESTGETQGPSQKTRYIQTRRMEVEHAGVHLSILLRDGKIDLQWSGVERTSEHIAFVPRSFQSADLLAKENMR